MSEKMKKYRACGLIDFIEPELDENGNKILDNWDTPVGELLSFNVHISVHATDEEEAWEKIYAMTPKQFKQEADAYWEDVGDEGEEVWKEVKDASDGIDWLEIEEHEITKKDVKAMARKAILDFVKKTPYEKESGDGKDIQRSNT
tara:strand:- start:1 stop:435 length:435 start_codon:yes stop_codon:yes gene_type:complete